MRKTMGFVSILGNEKRERIEGSTPVFFMDLNLDQVIEQIQAQCQTPVKKLYYELPVDKACEDYRRAIYTDIKKEEVYGILSDFVACMEDRKQALEKKQAVGITMQQAVWHMHEVKAYVQGFSKLYEGLLQAEITSEGLILLREYLGDYIMSNDFLAMKELVQKLCDLIENLHIKLVFENEQIVITEEQVPGTYDKFLKKALGVDEISMKSPFAQNLELSELEQELIQRIARKNPHVFEQLQVFSKRYRSYADETLLQFAEEVSYYLAYYAFQQKMELQGFSFVTPTVEEDKDMSAMGLYDLALACSSQCSECAFFFTNPYTFFRGGER